MVVQSKLRVRNFKALVTDVAASAEFEYRIGKNRLPASRQFVRLRPMVVDCDPSADQLDACLRVVRHTWSHLGYTKPHYSVLTQDRFLPSRIEDSMDEFWDLGQAEANTTIDCLRRVGMSGFRDKVCIEYGCGVGRVTMGLAKHFATVYAYDISPAHLDIARTKAQTLNITNIVWAACAEDMRVPLHPCDAFYSRIVLQHNPPPVIAFLIKKCLAALNKGGIGIFQVPTYGMGYRFDLDEWLRADHASDMQMHCLPQHRVFKLVRQADCELVEVVEDDCAGPPDRFISNTFVVRKVA